MSAVLEKKRKDYHWHEGDEPLIKFRVRRRDPANPNKWLPYDLTGTTARWVVKEKVGDEETAAVAKYGNGAGETGLSYTDALNGEGTVQITAAATLKGNRVYYFKLFINGKPRTLKHGLWEVEEI